MSRSKAGGGRNGTYLRFNREGPYYQLVPPDILKYSLLPLANREGYGSQLNVGRKQRRRRNDELFEIDIITSIAGISQRVSFFSHLGCI